MDEAKPSHKDGDGCMSAYSSSVSSSPDSPPSAPPPFPYIPVPTSYQLAFPLAIERFFQPIDDAVIRQCQRTTTGPVYSFSMTLTFFTAIEFLLVAPPTLYALGYDAAAGLATSVLLVLGVISQMPKKFIFRRRPWMVGRALAIREDKTSSFPSRAVVCATVFSWLIAQALYLEGFLPGQLSPLRLWFGIAIVASLAAFARINVGAHYPSDTLLGFLLGCVVIKIGVYYEQFWQDIGCGASYPDPAGSQILLDSSASALSHASWQRMAVVTLLAYAMTLVSIQGFWVKCSYVYGLLLSSAAFRAVFLCCRQMQGGACVAEVVRHGGWKEHVLATAMFVLLLVFGMVTRGRKGTLRAVTFPLIYIGTILGLLYWRLRPPLSL